MKTLKRKRPQTDDSKIPWDLVILGALRSGSEVALREVYDRIDEARSEGSLIISRQLFNIDPRWGERPKYCHVVRSAVSSLRKRGMVERLARGVYRITDAGRERLDVLE